MAPVTFKQIDLRDHNGVSYEAQYLYTEEFGSLLALRLKGYLTRMYPRSGDEISPIPSSELSQRTRAVRYANMTRTGVDISVDPTAKFEPDLKDGSAWNQELYCFEIARANIYQMCLCLAPRSISDQPHNLALPRLFERVGICIWNVFTNKELPRNAPVEISIV
jgi:hypothetical protein